MSADQAVQIFQQFRSNVVAERVEAAAADLEKLKRIMMEIESLPPLCIETPFASQERELFKNVLEYAVLLSILQQDKAAFQRSILSLRPYYTQFGYGSLAADSATPVILALNLLHLLVENRLADFHCELELLSDEAQQLPAILFCTQLEQHLVVGAYDLVLASAGNPPVPQFSFFLNSLLETVRLNIGDCLGSAYSTLKITSATKILMFQRNEETLEFIAENYPDWKVAGDALYLEEGKTTKSDEIPSMKLISQTLSYATELERIV